MSDPQVEQNYQKKREDKGIVIAALSKIVPDNGLWLVPSQTGADKRYSVDPFKQTCTCPDHEEHGHKCKHIYAVEFTIRREYAKDGTMTETKTITVTTKKPTYPQNWEAYNKAQINEKRLLLQLLHDLCAGFPTPPRPKGGRPAIPIADRLFVICWKVYCLHSSRRCGTGIDELVEKGLLSRTMHPNQINRCMEDIDLIEPLTNMIVQSSLPLAELETTFAADATGYSVSKHRRWKEENKNRVGKDWVKVHLICGVKTNIVTAAAIYDSVTNENKVGPELIQTTREHFDIKEFCGDAGYLSQKNVDAVVEAGGRPFIFFKKNSTGGVGGNFGKMYDYWLEQRPKFLQHYHQRSNVESTHSMIKRKFGHDIHSTSPIAMKNEVFAKLVCHNLCRLIHAHYELGLEPVFWQEVVEPAPMEPALTIDIPVVPPAALIERLPSYEEQLARMVVETGNDPYCWL